MKNNTLEKNRLANSVGLASGPMAESQTVTISAPRFGLIEFQIKGIAPYVSAKFPEKARHAMQEKHEAGSTAKGKKAREKRDFDADYKASIHFDEDGKAGMPASAFRKAMISACRLVDFKMTLAKLSVFVEADGYDETDGTPLVWIQGKHERNISAVRNATGVCDLRARAMWREWSAKVRVRFDLDQFTPADIANLMMRVGMQVGIGEGRPDSRESAGMGWGLFEVQQ